VPVPVDIAALSAALQQVGDQMREMDRAVARRQAAIETATRQAIAVQAARDALARAEAAHAASEQAVRDTDAAIPQIDRHGLDQRRAQIQDEIGRAVATNAAVAKAQAAEAHRLKLSAEHKAAAEEHSHLELEMAAIEESKRARLAAAALPVEGLGFTDKAVTYLGALLANASGAERMRVAIALAAAVQPQLRDVWIRDGAVISESSLAEISAWARVAGIRVWVERVETRDPGVIEIRDGRVVETESNQRRLFE
jgi:hypothetical protein